MTDVVVDRRRTGWDVVLGIVMVVGGLVILGNTVIATAVSVLFLGWVTLFCGIMALVSALFRIGRSGFWSAALSGGLLTVLGLFVLRYPAEAAITLTLMAGVVFLASGISRFMASYEMPQARWILIVSGVISVLLGLWVLFNLTVATFTLLGILLGVEVVVDGLTILLTGRLRVSAVQPASERAQV